MYNNNAQFTYQATRIQTATKEQLLLITYDIGIKACNIAENAMIGKINGGVPDYELANKEILRAQGVLRELMVTLNVEKAGEMGQKLNGLYDYMHNLLIDANIKKDPENIRVVKSMLEELKATWEEALMKLLQDYQKEHPDDAEFASAMSELKGEKPKVQPAPRELKTVNAAVNKNAKSGSFTLAG